MNTLKTKYSMSAPEKDKISHQVARHIGREFDGVVAAYLFGSFIGKDQFSDIDLGLLLKTRVLEVVEVELALEVRLEKIFNHPFDVRVLNDAPNSFVQNVIRTGRVVVDNDPGLRAVFEGNVLKQYFDFAYFRRRYLKEVGSAAI
jgi:predicted nucleotidyltransferase